MVSEALSLNQARLPHISPDMLHPSTQASLPHPYLHRDKCRNYKDDNICGGNPDIPRKSVPEYAEDLRRKRLHKSCPEKGMSWSDGLRHHPVRKKRLSSHCIQHRWWSPEHPRSLIHSAIPPAWRSPDIYKYSDEKPRPCRHSSDSGNPCHCSLRLGRLSFPGKSSRLKRYSKIPLPVPQKDLWPDICQNHTKQCAQWYVPPQWNPPAVCENRYKRPYCHHRWKSLRSALRFFCGGK